MRKILLCLPTLAMSAAAVPTLSAAISAPANQVIANSVATTQDTLNSSCLKTLETTTDVAWHEDEIGTGEIGVWKVELYKDELIGGVGPIFENPCVKNGNQIVMRTSYDERYWNYHCRFVKQKFAFDVEVPANSTKVYGLQIPFEFWTKIHHKLGHKTRFSATMELFNQGTDWNARPKVYTNSDEQQWGHDKLSVDYEGIGHISEDNRHDREFIDHSCLSTEYKLTNNTNKPVTKTCYFTLSLFIQAQNNGTCRTGCEFKGDVKLFDKSKNIHVNNFARNGMLGFHEHNYYSGNTVPFSDLNGGCGPMFHDPTCSLKKDGSYDICLNTCDKRQSERIIHQGFVMELVIPPHLDSDFIINVKGQLTAYSQRIYHQHVYDASLQMFDLGDSCHNQPEFFTNYNWEKQKVDKRQVGENHVYDENVHYQKTWDNQNFSLTLRLTNNTDEPITVYHYISLSMFLGGYNREIANFGSQYNANVSFETIEHTK